MRNAPIYQYSPLSAGQPSDVYSFSPKIGDAAGLNGKAQRVKQTINIRTGAVHGASDDGTPSNTSRQEVKAAVFTEFDPRAVANTYTDLAARVAGAQDDHSWIYTAKASLRGHAGTVPSSMIYLQGLDGDWDGYWTVTSMDHKYDSHFHDEMTVELGTNSLGAPLRGYVGGTVSLADMTQRRPKARYSLAAPRTSNDAVMQDLRGTSANPLVWQGQPASLDASDPEKRIPAASLKRIRHGQ